MQFKWRSSLVNHRRHHDPRLNIAARKKRARPQWSEPCTPALKERQEQHQHEELEELEGPSSRPDEDIANQLLSTVQSVHLSPDEASSPLPPLVVELQETPTLSASSNLTDDLFGSNTVQSMFMQNGTNLGMSITGDIFDNYFNLARYPL
eukprot:CAMPEP_0198731424 /NCGR_PEP_ID=MMETSP1475-20131203/29744_1 /TAXON_ID= ORGANISM="Unidentified sp., Strain CCMP1999" /NCGR_SAMPLE_ID=MMETSP1475 /ASSEMBLY_ACC=CAM_ASM_001111 /LENGTH=149 /DNA_ID=CAMNT_0044494387 /DNA_START=192 /DNA_END=641 /DNA_ORIENTATION=-